MIALLNSGYLKLNSNLKNSDRLNKICACLSNDFTVLILILIKKSFILIFIRNPTVEEDGTYLLFVRELDMKTSAHLTVNGNDYNNTQYS